jgi:hypothetical protein
VERGYSDRPRLNFLQSELTHKLGAAVLAQYIVEMGATIIQGTNSDINRLTASVAAITVFIRARSPANIRSENIDNRGEV